MERDGRRQGLAPHFPECWGPKGAAPFFQDSEAGALGAPAKIQRNNSTKRNPKNDRGRESRDYYPSQLGLTFGADAGYHTFLLNPLPTLLQSLQIRGEGNAATAQRVHRVQPQGQGVRQGRKRYPGELDDLAAFWAPTERSDCSTHRA